MESTTRISQIRTEPEKPGERHGSLTAGAASGLFCLWLAILIFAACGEWQKPDAARSQSAHAASGLNPLLSPARRDAVRAVLAAELKQAGKARSDVADAFIGARSPGQTGESWALLAATRAAAPAFFARTEAFRPRAPPAGRA